MTEIKQTKLESVNRLATLVRETLESPTWTEPGDGVSATEMLGLSLAIGRLRDRVDMLETNLSPLRQIRYNLDSRKK